MKRRVNWTISESAYRQAVELAELHGSISEAVDIAVRELYQKEIGTMGRYGYQDMSEGYSDVNPTQQKATCPACGRRHYATAEECWEKDGVTYADDLCSEYDGVEYVDTRQHEW